MTHRTSGHPEQSEGLLKVSFKRRQTRCLPPRKELNFLRSSMKIHCIIVLLLLTAQIGVTQPYEGPDTLWTGLLSPARYAVALNGWETGSGFILAGAAGDTQIAGEQIHDYFLTNVDMNGNVIWSRQFQWIGNVRATSFLSACPTTDGGTLVVGGASCGLLFMKVDNTGDTLWTRCYLPPVMPLIRTVKVIPVIEGGFLLYGQAYTDANNDNDGFLWKISETGEPQWTRYYPGGYLTRESVDDILPLPGGYLLAISMIVHNPQTIRDSTYFYALWTNLAGDVWRNRSFAFGAINEVRSVCSDSNSRYYFAGSVEQDSMNPARLLFCLDSSGTQIWQLISPADPQDWSADIVEVVGMESGCIALGNRSYWHFDDALLTRFSAAGDTLWSSAYRVPFHDPLHANTFFVNHLIARNDGGYLLVGNNQIPFPVPAYGVALISTAVDPLVTSYFKPTITDFALEQNYPNPFNSTTQIEFTLPVTQRVSLRLYDVLGRAVAVLLDGMQTAGEHRVRFNGNGLSSGVYFCRMEAGKEMRTQKIVLMK